MIKDILQIWKLDQPVTTNLLKKSKPEKERCEKGDRPKNTKTHLRGVQSRQRATDPGEHASVPLLGQVDAVSFEDAGTPAQPALAAGAQLAAEVALDADIFVAREGRGDPALRSERQGFAQRAVGRS